MLELFGYYLQGGLIDVGFLGAAQIDRFGNINTTVIGPYDHPTTRLPGSGGACEIAINARAGVRDHAPVDALSSSRPSTSGPRPGNLGGAEQATYPARGRLARPGPTILVTDLGIYHFDETGEMRLDSLHPGATVEAVRATIGWEVKVADDLAATPPRRPRSCGSSARSSTRAASTRSRVARLRRLSRSGPASRVTLVEVDEELEGARVGDGDDEPADVRRRDPEVRRVGT